jgi:DNA polymerase III delta subunit
MLYLFFGEDDYTVRALARAVETRYVDPVGSPSVLRLDGATTPWDDVVAACRVLPFLSAHQVVRLNGLIGAWGQRRARNLDEPAAPEGRPQSSLSRRRSTSAEDSAKPGASPVTLAALAGTLPETTVLVLEEGPLGPANAHLKALAALDIPKEIRACPLLEGAERVRWVREEVAKRGGSVDAQAATELAGRLSGSLWAVSSAIDTLLAYVGAGGRITSAAVQELVAPGEDAHVFHLTDAIADRQSGRALTLLHTVLATGMAQEQVLAMLVGRVRDWTLVKALQAEKVPEGAATSRLGWSAGKYRRVARGAATFARGELPRAYQALVIADEALKSRPGDERLLILDLLVLTLADRGDPQSLRQTFPILPAS